jgi:hypothetical protein
MYCRLQAKWCDECEGGSTLTWINVDENIQNCGYGQRYVDGCW